ncbi:hypothetical protein IAE22_31305, partial [Bacillus sp. S34]|nr:hypothetical protein [Bacillus sp. S34]
SVSTTVIVRTSPGSAPSTAIGAETTCGPSWSGSRLAVRAIALGAQSADQVRSNVSRAAAVVPVPDPVRTGRPALGYPWSWSIVRWLPGTPVGERAAGVHVAEALAAFVEQNGGAA